MILKRKLRANRTPRNIWGAGLYLIYWVRVMLKRLFNIGMGAKLHNLVKTNRKGGWHTSNEVFCSVSKATYNYYATVYTNNESITGIGCTGNYSLYTSKEYRSYREALLALTEEVANIDRTMPGFSFFRWFRFEVDEYYKYYLQYHSTMEGKDKWLERAVQAENTNRTYQRHQVVEKFELGSWILQRDRCTSTTFTRIT